MSSLTLTQKIPSNPPPPTESNKEINEPTKSLSVEKGDNKILKNIYKQLQILTVPANCSQRKKHMVADLLSCWCLGQVCAAEKAPQSQSMIRFV